MTDEQKQKDPNHWIADEGNRRAFWAKVKDEFGLTEQQVHAALDIESLYDTTSKQVVVESQLRWYAKGILARQWEQDTVANVLIEWASLVSGQLPSGEMPEAPASINTFTCTADGYNTQLTLRGYNEARLIERFLQMTSALKQLGFHPCNRYGDPVTTIAQSSVQQAFQEQAAHDQGNAPPLSAQQALARPNAPPQSGQFRGQAASTQDRPAQGPPAGNGTPQGNGGGMIQCEFIKVTAPRGEAVIEFWRPNRQYAEIRHNLGAADLLEKSPALVEAGWTVEHFTVGEEYTAPVDVHWVPSANLNKKGQPYKNISRVEPR